MREINSSILPQANVERWINDAHSQTLKERHYRFMDEVVSFDTSQDTTITADIAAGATSISVADSTGLPSSGTVSIDDDVIAFSANSSNTLTVTGVGSAHESGAELRRIYALSADLSISDLDKPIYMTINEQEVVYYDGRGGVKPNGYKLDDDDFLYIPFNGEARRVLFKYKKIVAQLTTDAATFLIPDDYVTMVVEKAISRAKSDLGFSQVDIQQNEGEYMRMKRKMRNDFGQQTENRNQRIATIYQPGYIRT